MGERQQGLASTRQLAPLVARSSLSRAVRAGRVQQVRPRVYALEPLPALPLHVVTQDGPDPAWVAHVRAGLLSVSSSAASGRTAAALHGWGLLAEPTTVVNLAAAVHTRVADRHLPVRSVRSLSVATVSPLRGTRGLRVTDPVSTVLRCCLDLPLVEAVVVCDSALRAGAVSMEELARLAARLPGQQGAAEVRGVLALADGLAESVLESAFRVRAVQGGVTGLEPQVVIRDAGGRHVLRADFASVPAHLVVELDGTRWHPDPVRDRLRDNCLAELGWRVLRFGWRSVVYDHEDVVRQVRAALAPAPAVLRRAA